jgi:hypothetical protein
MTTILFDSRRVKTASTFGRGVLPRPSRRFEPSMEDRAWAAEFDLEAEDRTLEQMGQEAAWLDLIERGIRPF